MSIGYACLTIGVQNTSFKNCILKNANEVKLLEIIENNLKVLERIIDYNIENDIKLFRISSDLIPFGSSPGNQLPWWDIFALQFRKIGDKIRSNNIRVSMHPGQYTVLNSPNTEVVERAYKDLNYHAKVLGCLGVKKDHKIILHIGGVYNNKQEAIERFIKNYNQLDEKVKERLVIENDDKLYHINDILEISSIINAPVIYDNLHNTIHPFDKTKDDYYWINKCKKTWNIRDGKQKIHYSQQQKMKKPGSHSKSIEIEEFLNFYNGLDDKDIDIMLEVKDKNLSAIKCVNATSSSRTIKKLELEWKKYKYCILESSPLDYVEIRNLLKDKNTYPVIAFYKRIENALQAEVSIGHAENAALHVWGYFKNIASEQEKGQFEKKLAQLKEDGNSIKYVKNYLRKLAEKYHEEYLLEGYYFTL